MSSKPARNPAARSWSLAARLTLWYAGSALALILTATVSMYWMLARNLDVEEDRFIRNEIRDIHRILENRSDDLNELRSELEDELTASGYVQVYARVLDQQSRTIAQTQGMPLGQAVFPSPVAAGSEPQQGLDVTADGKTYFRCMAAQMIVGTADHPRTYVIQVAMDQAIEFDLLAKYRQRLGRVLAVAFFACVFIGYWIARRGIRPIREISRMAQRVQSTTLHERIITRGLPAELLTLANLFNDMLGRLEESFDRLSQFSANIAHELRTPVNNLRGMAEVTLRSARSAEEYRDTLGSCLEECVRLSRTIDSLLFLARAEQAQIPIRQEPLNVAEELQVVRDFYEAAATAAGVALTVRAQPGLITGLDRTLFQRAVGNLITNALAYTPRSGAVMLNATRGKEGVCVEAADTGCGIPPEQLPYVFDRFHRVRPASSPDGSQGLGLGLAIVKSIATLHGGSVRIASDVGRGTRVTLIFPLLPRELSAAVSPLVPPR